jgi:hypothetical protein
VLAGIIWVALRYSSWWRQFLPRTQEVTRADLPTSLFGLDLRQDSLPNNIKDAAMRFWQQGHYRNALSLLYRASLMKLLQLGIPLKDSSTELECLDLMIQHPSPMTLTEPQVEYFKALTQAWRLMAYGHQIPEPTQGLHLCQTWTSVWETTQ